MALLIPDGIRVLKEQSRKEKERQRVIQALARLESPQDGTMQITMTLSQYIEVVLGEPSDPAT